VSATFAAAVVIQLPPCLPARCCFAVMARKKLSAAKKAAKAAAAAAAGTIVEHHSSDNDSSAPESTSSKPELKSAVDASNKGKAVAEARSPAGNASINIEESKGKKIRR
jgi:hypothetical protein